MQNQKIFGTTILVISYLVNLLILLLLFSSLPIGNMHWLFNSDALYMASFYKDLIIDGNTLKGWDLSTASLIFPNVIIFFIFMSITSNFLLAQLLHGFTQYFLFIFLINYLLVTLDKKVPKTVLASVNLIVALCPLYSYLSGDFLTSSFFFLPYHMGAFIIALLSLIWMIKYLQSEHNIFLWLIIIVTPITIFSDRIFIVYFSSISICTLILLYFFNSTKRKSILKIFISILISSILGLVLFRLGYISNYISFTYTDIFGWSRIIPSFKLMFFQYSLYFIANSLEGYFFKLAVISFLLFIIMFYLFLKRKTIKNQNIALLTIILFVIIFAVGVWLAPALNGLYFGFDCIRYNIYVVFLLVALLPHVLYLLLKNKVLNQVVLISLAIVLAFPIVRQAYNNTFSLNLKTFLNYYPEVVKKADSLALKYNLKLGAGNYWAAKPITIFSKTGLRVYSTYAELNPFILSDNRNWYYDFNHKNSRPTFDFIIKRPSNDSITLLKYMFQDSAIKVEKLDTFLLFMVRPFHFMYNRPGPIINGRKVIGSFYFRIDSMQYRINPIPIKNLNARLNVMGQIDSTISFSGKYSIKTIKEPDCAFIIDLDSVKKADDYIVSIWKYPETEKAGIEISFDNGYAINNYYESETSKKGWKKLLIDVKVPYELPYYKMRIVIRNLSKSEINFDDLNVERLK